MPKVAEQEEADVHPDHHEFALGEVDDLDHAEDQRDADTDERVDAADEQAVDDGLDHCLQHLRYPPAQVFSSGARASSFGKTLARSPFCHCTPTGRP